MSASAGAGAGAGAGAAVAKAKAGGAMKFWFTGGGELAEPQLATEVGSLNAFSAAQLNGFVDTVIAFLLNPAQVDLVAMLNQFATEHGVNLRALKNVCRGLLVLLKSALKHNVSAPRLKEDLMKLRLDAEKAGIIEAKWRASHSDLSSSLVTSTLMVNKVVDMEWTFGVTAASSEVEAVGGTYLQLKLVIDKGVGSGEDSDASREEAVHMELTLPQFYEFLASMEQAKTYLDFLST